MSAFSDGTDHRGGHSRVTQFRNQEDTGGHARSRARRQSSTGGHARNRRDTDGRTVVPVRDREAPGSNPGPPTSLLNSKSPPTTHAMAFLGLTGHRRGTHSLESR